MPLDTVRPSRAGDQFHYLWAARRCLKLLHPNTELVSVVIEGVSPEEGPEAAKESGEEVIDVAEYFGSESLVDCKKVVYYQLKHSTLRASEPWLLGDLKTTLCGFYKRYRAFIANASDIEKQEVKFIYLTNRPVADWVKLLLGRIQEREITSEDNKKWEQIKGYLNSSDKETYEFLDRFFFEDNSDGYWEQRNSLSEDLAGYLPGVDKDGADQLWLLVTKKALPENSTTPAIYREDVLRALKTDGDALFPAPCLIESQGGLFERSQEREFIDAINRSDGTPIVIHAEGGVGKSALARRLTERLSELSTVILFDCFGNGSYRNSISPRHTHDVGLVQIANELSSLGLCHPMIPDRLANSQDYQKAFIHRLQQSTNVLQPNDAQAKLILFIDAADNAQMAAEELGEKSSFPRDLLRQNLPEGTILVCLSRTHRVKECLNPPPECINLELLAFEEAETEKLLRETYTDATDHDVKELHRLSSANPRVQATALETTNSLEAALEALGPTATTVEDSIRGLFAKAINRLIDQSPNAEASQIKVFCAALAALRPSVPIEALALASGLSAGAIRSFVIDLGRPLSIRGDAVQFIDEPSETWFRETYKPEQNELSEFIRKLRPLAKQNGYVASALPQLMLEAGEYDALVDMVLSEADLPNANPVEKRQTSLKRLQFALKAALRDSRHKDAAKLALKAGVETAGDDRQQQLIQDNTDLVSRLLSADRLREVVANNEFSTGWHGGHRVYEAGLLAGQSATLSEARNTLRVAHKWLRSWSQLDSEEREKEEISINDIAELCWVSLHIDGPEKFVTELERWTPKDIAFRAGLIVANKLVDLAEYDLLDAISAAAENNPSILFATIEAQSPILRYPPQKLVQVALDGLKLRPKLLREFGNELHDKEPALSLATCVAQAAAHYKISPRKEIADTLTHYIPAPKNLYFSNFSAEPKLTILRANCLRAELLRENIEIHEIAKEEIREEIKENSQVHGRDAREFIQNVNPVFLWHRLWAKVLLGDVEQREFDTQIELCLEASGRNTDFSDRDERHIKGEIARLWIEILACYSISNSIPDTSIARFLEWKKGLKRKLFTPDLNYLTRICAKTPSLNGLTVELANETAEIIRQERMEAEQKVDGYCSISRAIFALSKEEASCYFDLAVEVAGKIGQEHLDYWTSIIELANKAATPKKPRPDLAHRLSRAAEVIYDFVARDKYFDWEGTVEALVSLCPSSSMAIISRWRDRDFGWQVRICPIATKSLVELGEIHSASRLAMLGFQHDMDNSKALQVALQSTDNKHLIQAMFDETSRYSLIEGGTTATLLKLEKIGTQHDWMVEELTAARGLAEQKDYEAENKRDYSRSDIIVASEKMKNWNAIFSSLEEATTTTIEQAYKKFRSGKPPFYFGPFASELFGRINIGDEAHCLRELFGVSKLSLYEIREVFEAIPNDWGRQKCVKRALAGIVEGICRKHFHEISKSRYYQPLPFEIITKTTGISKDNIFKIVVDESAHHPDLVGSQRLFTLVGLIASTLSEDEAKDVLGYGLLLLEEDMDEDDGDGKCTPDIIPPASANVALAGYIWGAFASPNVALRWQAAHTVRLLCIFEQTDVLVGLAKLALGEEENTFFDKSLLFYELAAKQWLMISLLRAAQDDCNIPSALVNVVKALCAKTEKHVIIRGLAAKILLKLSEIGSLELDASELARLGDINQSKLPKAESQSYSRILTGPIPDKAEKDDRYYFGYDISRYWFESLARIFSFNSSEIEARAMKVIRKDWGVDTRGGWADDPRGKRGFYRDMTTYHSHGSYPKIENLSFHHSYHSMMVVAGELLDTAQAFQDPEYSDEIEDWIQGHWLTRNDGKWLADRRDPKPTEFSSWKTTKEVDEWPGSVAKCDLLKEFIKSDNSYVAWGSWNEVSGDREQRVSISSALVSPNTSGALLRALQTAKTPMDYRIPFSGEDFEIDESCFRMRGWIVGSSREFGIDDYDPWAGDIHYSTLKISDHFCDVAGIAVDTEQRYWSSKADSSIVLAKSSVWGRKAEDRESRSPESGECLTVDRTALLGWLAELDMDLISEIQIRREFRRDSYRNRDNKINTYAYPYSLILVLTANGTIKTI